MNPTARSVEPRDETDNNHSSFDNPLSPAYTQPSPLSHHSSASYSSSSHHFADNSADLENIDCSLAKLENLDFSPTKPENPDFSPVAKNDDLSLSFGSSSKHLSCSESQDTLHSCTNSITESDVNANFQGVAESKEAVEEEDHREDCDSDVFDSESSSSGYVLFIEFKI